MIGQTMRSLRTSRKLTLDELADKLNSQYPNTVTFNKGKLSKWENEKEEPKLSSVRILADFYNITVDDFYDKNCNTTTLSLINNTVKQLNEDRQESVLNFAREQLKEQKIT